MLLCCRHTYANMLHMLDSGVANVTAALTARGLWANTLLLFTADNGGIGGVGNNHPLRGHKHDPWEGGTRATAFLTGGFLPAALRGTNSGDKLVAIADWCECTLWLVPCCWHFCKCHNLYKAARG
jgi:arylsulfatase A-like enzyme